MRSGRAIRRLWSRYVPHQARDPLGLLSRIVETRDPAALYALWTTGLGVAALPFDLALSPFERRRYRKAPDPSLPVVLVCGAPRTGTSVATLTLTQGLDVQYFNNLTAVFPRAPLTANTLFGRMLPEPETSYHTFYGKTVGLARPNDALYLWDRWLGTDRRAIRQSLPAAHAEEMRRFFGAVEAHGGKPVVNKNNNLNTQAHLVAEALPTARFVCMTRDPLYHAQSLWIARLIMYGAPTTAYGIPDPDSAEIEADDPVRGVCNQVLFHARAIREQQRRLGADRFWIVSYEDFCENPEALLRRVSEEILGRPYVAPPGFTPPRNFVPSRQRRLPDEVFERIRDTLERLGDAPDAG